RMLDAMQVGDSHGAPVALVDRQRTPRRTEPRRDGADAERLADVARERLCDRAVVLHPIELPDVPQIGIAHRRIARLIVALDEMIAEDRVADAPERVRAAEAFSHRIEAAQRIVLSGAEHGEHARTEPALERLLTLGIVVFQHLPRETIELQ